MDTCQIFCNTSVGTPALSWWPPKLRILLKTVFFACFEHLSTVHKRLESSRVDEPASPRWSRCAHKSIYEPKSIRSHPTTLDPEMSWFTVGLGFDKSHFPPPPPHMLPPLHQPTTRSFLWFLTSGATTRSAYSSRVKFLWCFGRPDSGGTIWATLCHSESSTSLRVSLGQTFHKIWPDVSQNLDVLKSMKFESWHFRLLSFHLKMCFPQIKHYP